MPELLRAENLTKRFNGAVAVDRASLLIAQGEIVGVAGRSGSGKTTLLSMLCGLLPMDGGRLWLEGSELTGAPPARWAKARLESMGFVFQNYLLDPDATARQNVALPLLLLDCTVGESNHIAGRALEAVGLDADMIDRPSAKLSGGQRQRVAFARAIAANPPLILADEPTGNLDARTARELLGLARRMRDERGTSFLLVTHDPLMEEFVDRVYRIDGGRLDEAEKAGVERAAIDSE